MDFFHVKTLLETSQLITTNVSPLERFQHVSLQEALGRVASCDIVAQEPVPAFARSSVDGYAVKAADTFGVSESMPGFLSITGEVNMGEACLLPLATGDAVYVPTGGMLPKDADAMVMIEHVEKNQDLLCVYRQVAPGENVISVGEDYREGSLLISKGTSLRAQELGALAANGVTDVQVYAMPVITYFSTGDEIVDFGAETLPLGKVRSINNLTVATVLRGFGCEVRDGGILPDNQQALEEACRYAVAASDCLVISGGSSVGEKDYAAEMINDLGAPGVYVHGIAMKPGKPTILANAAGKPVIGLPGHPAAALIVLHVVARQVIDRLLGLGARTRTSTYAKSACRVASAVGRTDFIRVRLVHGPDGYIAEPVHGKSGLISTLVDCDGLLLIREALEGIDQGDIAEVLFI